MKHCDRTNCTKEAVYQVSAELRPHPKASCATATLDLYVCADHAKAVTFDEIFPAEGWQRIVNSFTAQGLMAPRRVHSKIVLKPVKREQ